MCADNFMLRTPPTSSVVTILRVIFLYFSDEDWNTEPTEDSLFLVQNNGWPSKELSLPRARRHNSSGFDSTPVTSPGSANTSPDDHRFIHEPLQYCSPKKPVRSIPSSDFERKQHKYAEDLRTPTPRNTFFDKVASKSEMRLDTSSPAKKRNPEDRQRSPSPTEIVSPKERFKDAKEKFLLLERERLEEQEKRLQQNLEKRKSLDYGASHHSGHHQPIHQQASYQQSSHQQHIPVAKPRSSKNWKRDTSDEVESKSRYRHGDERLHEDDFEQQPIEKRRSISRLSYQRNKSMESLNSEEYPSIASGSYKNSIDNGSSNMISQSRSKHYDEDSRYNGSRMTRYHNADIENGGGRRCKSPVMAPRPAARSYSEDYLPDHHEAGGKRYHQRDMSRSQHSVPFANDEAIPLQRYRSPTRQVDNPRLSRSGAAPASAAAAAYPYVAEEESQRRVKRSDSKYYAKPTEHDKRRSMMDAIEDEKRRNSNEIAKEFKRRSYQDHRTGSEISYQGEFSTIRIVVYVKKKKCSIWNFQDSVKFRWNSIQQVELKIGVPKNFFLSKTHKSSVSPDK